MAGFEIDGERYEVVPLDEMTLRECRTLWLLTRELQPDGTWKGIVQEDFEPPDPNWEVDERIAFNAKRSALFERPDFKIALAAIVYMRRHPDVTVDEAGQIAESANALEVSIAMILGGDDVDPTMSSIGSQKPQPNQSDTSELSASEDSGKDSALSGSAQETSRETTGTSESDWLSRGVPPIGSAK